MAKHPKDGSVTSPATLAEERGTSTQTISYYINGKRKPSYDNVIALTKFFGVSADYLLFHVKAENMDMHKKTGLSNEAITMLEQMHKTSKNGVLTDITALVDSLLSDRVLGSGKKGRSYVGKKGPQTVGKKRPLMVGLKRPLSFLFTAPI